MSVVADLLFYLAIALCCAGVLLNLKYVLTLPGRVPRDARWAGFVWLIMLFGLGSWGRAYSDKGVTTVTDVDSSALIQVVSIAIAGMTMLLMARRSFDSRNFHAPFVLLLIFALVGVLSAPISAFAALSLFKASSVVVAVLLAVMAVHPLTKTQNPNLLFNTVYIYFALISFLAMIGGVLHPHATRMVSTGVFGFMLKGWPALNPNSLSYVGAVVLVVSLHRIFAERHFRRRLLYVGVGSTGAIALVLSQGRTSLASAFIAILFMAYFIKAMRPFRYVILGSSALLVLLFIVTGSVGGWIDGIGEYLRRGVDDQQLETLSGRTEAWAESWNLFLSSPMLGYGFYATGKTLLAPHNAYFAVLLNGGLLGFLPWLLGVLGGFWAIFTRFLRRSWREYSTQNSYFMEMVAVMIVQFFRTVTSQDITIHSYSMLIFLSVLIYIYARERIHRDPAADVSGAQDLGLATVTNGRTTREPRILRERRAGNTARPERRGGRE